MCHNYSRVMETNPDMTTPIIQANWANLLYLHQNQDRHRQAVLAQQYLKESKKKNNQG